MYVRMYVCMYVCMYVPGMYVCMYVCIDGYTMYVAYMYVCMYVCIMCEDVVDPLAGPTLNKEVCFGNAEPSVPTNGGARIRRFRPRGWHENNPSRGWDYIIPA